MAAKGGDILCQPAGDHQRGRAAQLLLNAGGDAVQQHRRAQHRAGEHTALGVGADGVFGRGEMHLRQLGAALPQCPQARGEPRADNAAPEHPVLVHHIKGGGGAQIDSDHRQREIGRRVGRVHNAVLAHGVGVGHPHGQPGADLRRDDDGLFARVVAGTLGQRPRDLGHNTGQHGPLKPDGPLRVAAVGKHFLHFGTVLRRRAGAYRVHVGHKAYTSVLDAPQGDGGVAYINGKNHIETSFSKGF